MENLDCSGDVCMSCKSSRVIIQLIPDIAHNSQTAPGEGDPNQSLDAVQEIRTKFDGLKAQYIALMKVMQSSMQETALATSFLPVTPKDVSVKRAPTTTSVSATRRSVRNSIATSASESFVEWFDAEDEGPQEFTMEIEPEVELVSPPVPVDDDNSSVNTEIVNLEQLASPVPEIFIQDTLQVVRRTQLPCLCPSDEGSLFTILKKNVGKVSKMIWQNSIRDKLSSQDLSTITFPVTFNEPLTMLQRAAEEVEYYQLLDEAARAKDPVSRIAYVAAFAVSGYAQTRHRSGRKGL